MRRASWTVSTLESDRRRVGPLAEPSLTIFVSMASVAFAWVSLVFILAGPSIHDKSCLALMFFATASGLLVAMAGACNLAY